MMELGVGFRACPGWVVPLLYCLFTGGPTLEAQTPAPEADKWAPTTVALLQHVHERCSGISTRIVTYWKTLSGNEPAVRQALDRYVLTKATADLAGARRALDLARTLLPRATVEIDSTRGVVLNRLYEAEATLCDLVAQPDPPLATFEEKLLKAIPIRRS